MKLNVLAVSVFMTCATGSLMSMDQKKQCLNFRLNNNTEIQAYSAQNMEFLVKPEDFLGKSLLDVVSLSEQDERAIMCGFGQAIEKQETVKVPYVLEKNNFMATITAMATAREADYEYFVKCTPNK